MAAEMDAGRSVRELYEALNKQDLNIFDRVVGDQMEYVDFALGETLRGKEAFKKHFKNWWTAFPRGTGEIRNMMVSADQVMVEVVGRGNQMGPFETSHGMIGPTNQEFEFHFCQVFRVKNGRIVSGHTYSDAFQMFEAGSEVRKAA